MTTHHHPRHGRLHWVLAPFLLLACSGPQASDDDRRASRPLPASPADAAVELGVTPLAMDARGVPQLLRASRVAPAPGATATESALKHLGQLSPAWGVAKTALPKLQGIGEVPAHGATIVRVRQTIDGLPVDRGELRVMVRGNGALVATNGALVSADTSRQAATFPIDDTQAIARAVAHNYQQSFDAAALALRERRTDGTRMIAGRHGDLDVQLARARKVWHHTGAMLIPAWHVEAYAGKASSTDGDAFRTLLTADGRTVLSHRSLVADVAFNYRVFAETAGELRLADGPVADYSPHPTGTPDGQFPPYVAPSLVSVDGLNNPAGQATPDPWLLSTRTETLGNNVEAYTDISPPSGFTFGDFRATVTGTRTFDRTYDTAASPLSSQAQQMASITSAFYGINWLHDFWYDAGFTEAAGNGQDNNYGRGGEDRDAMLAETQDNAPNSLNNANMSTPSDGLPPRMQIFIWTGKEDRSLTIQPANRTPAVGSASFGPFAFDTTAPIVLGVDGTDPAGDGCQPLTNVVTGQLVLVDRGTCSFKTKALNIQNAGGAGMILANNAVATLPPGMGNDTAITTPITIGSLSVTLDEGNLIKADLMAGAVTGVSHRLVPLLDGGLDSTLLAHEFGHYLHHRLQDCGTKWCSAQSEGWGDFLALMLMMRDGDNYEGAYPFSIYSTQGFTDQPAYFGIRRVPYSTNPAINTLSYRHMADGEALPMTHPFINFGNANSEVHNAGEIWAQMMHEAYVSLLKVPGATFTDVRAKMAKYVVSGLLMAPRDATPDQTRDAIFAAAAPADQDVIIAAFARRGLGTCAVTPGPASTTFAPIVESTLVRGVPAGGATSIDDSVTSCDDDHILDAGETARISVPIFNRGHAALTDVKVTVTSTTDGITVTSAPAMIASLPAAMSQDVGVEVKLDKAASGPLEGKFSIKIEASNGCTSEVTADYETRLNVDDVPASSATDAFDAPSIWKPSEATNPLWTQVAQTVLDREWHGQAAGSISDTYLESPEVAVGATAPFKVTFSHRHKFEYDGTTAWDGGVIEYSVNNGAAWADVAALGAMPGYAHTITTTSSNPIGGRMAYSSTNPAYPNNDTVTLDFGTQLAGMSVKLRFRIGTDQAISDEGWFIDDVAFEGITNTPFPTQVEDRTMCEAGPGPMPMPDAGGGGGGDDDPSDEQPGCCDAGPIRTSNLALALGVLGLLVLRRRRRR